MLSLNPCLKTAEITTMLQLTSKNLENINGNEFFIGKIGSGKLEVGHAVSFVNEAMLENGTAVISNQDFWRFNFNLERLNNNLIIENQIFRDDNISNFVAKNSIRINPNSKLSPNENGFVHLNINPNINICEEKNNSKDKDYLKINSNKNVVNYKQNVLIIPNPNNGIFNLSFASTVEHDVDIQLFDINGRLILNQSISKDSFLNNSYKIDIQNYQQGIYLLKVNFGEYNKTIKVIKK